MIKKINSVKIVFICSIYFIHKILKIKSIIFKYESDYEYIVNSSHANFKSI